MKPAPAKDIRDGLSFEVTADQIHLAIKGKLAALTSAITTHQNMLKDSIKSVDEAVSLMSVLHGGINLSPEAERIRARLDAINDALFEIEDITLFQRYLVPGATYVLDTTQMRKYGL